MWLFRKLSAWLKLQWREEKLKVEAGGGGVPCTCTALLLAAALLPAALCLCITSALWRKAGHQLNSQLAAGLSVRELWYVFLT